MTKTTVTQALCGAYAESIKQLYFFTYQNKSWMRHRSDNLVCIGKCTIHHCWYNLGLPGMG